MKAATFVCGILLLALGAFGQSNSPAASNRSVPKTAADGAHSSPTSSQTGSSGRRRSMQSSESGLSFANAVTYSTGGYQAEAIAAVDVNGDGYPDLIVANYCGLDSGCTANGTVAVLLNNGNGTFAPAVSYGSGGYFASFVAVSDVNADGKPDIVVVNGCGSNSNCTTDGSVAVLLGNGDGTFQSATTYDTGGFTGQFVAIADVNGDGKPDLLVVNRCGISSTCSTGQNTFLDSTVAVLLGNGDGTFQTAVNYDTEVPYSEMLAVGDVNGDGNPDLAVVNNCFLDASCEISTSGTEYLSSVSILQGNGSGTFTFGSNFYSGTAGSTAIALGDLNNDGDLDIVVNDDNGGFGYVAVLLGNGNGTFQNPTLNYLEGGGAGQVTIADVNGDGYPDLEASVLCGGVRPDCGEPGYPVGAAVLLGNGDGTFEATQDFGSVGYTYGPGLSLAVADLDGDGRPDLAFTVLCLDSSCAHGSPQQSIVGVLINTTTFPNSSPTTTALASSLNPSNVGQSITFTATVTPSGSSSIPAGTVNLSNGSTSLGVFALTGGVATAQIATLPAGTQSVTATYNGSSVYTSSTSAAFSQVVRGIVVSPSSLNFPTQNSGTTSSPMTVTVTNTSLTAVSISSIAITGANSSNFSQTNNCPGSLSAGGSCSINVTFSPNATGSFAASLNISDSLPGSPQTVALAGSGLAGLALSPASITFPNQYVGTTGLPQTVTLTNNGGSAITIASVSTSTSDFGSLSSCGNSVSPASSCAIGVFFDPTQGGSRSGVLTVTDSTADALTVALTGNGEDFSMNSSSPTATVAAGGTATYTLDLSALGGFDQTVALSCDGAPSNATCSLSEHSVALKGSATSTVTVTVATAGGSARLTKPVAPRGDGRLAVWLFLAGMPGLVLVVSYGCGSRKRRSRTFHLLGLLCLFAAVIIVPACGGGSNNNGNGGGTLAGTYSLTLTGSFTSGSTNLAHTVKLTLVVQ